MASNVDSHVRDSIEQHDDTHVHGPNCQHDHHHRLEPYVRDQPKIGRNDTCPCGSGNKFKKCCGKP